MKYVLERVAAPEIEPLTLAEAKLHLGEFDDITTHDNEIEALIAAAREWVEDYTGRALIDQTWRITFGDAYAIDRVVTPSCACDRSEERGAHIYLRKSPALSIVSFVQIEADGSETALDPDAYELREADGKWPRVVAMNGGSWAAGEFRLVFRAGYANRDVSPPEGAEVVPNRFKQAIKLWIEANYDRDKDMMGPLIETATGLIRSERVELGIA